MHPEDVYVITVYDSIRVSGGSVSALEHDVLAYALSRAATFLIQAAIVIHNSAMFNS
jgi:hypothetical protein